MTERGERGRFSAKRKLDAVIRVIKGEPLDALSREFGVTAATLSEWRDQFLAGAEANRRRRTFGCQIFLGSFWG